MALTMTSGQPWCGLSILQTLPLWLGVTSPAMAGAVHGTTRENQLFKHLATKRLSHRITQART